ncbi:MAG TPA: alpha/beta hydrolase [Nitrososphaerales archaeon]|nr:alpha/beta hydrolase [Nitrososphaerales archaeon]
MPSIDVDGVSLYYELAGKGEPVLFSHGIPTDYRAWSAQVGEFSKSYSTVTYSRRYAAPNQRDGDVSDSTVEANAADLKGLIEKLGIAPVHLVGHSYGGFVAAYLAADRPGLVRSLVLVEPAIATLLVEDPNSSGQMFALLIGNPGVALSARRFQSGSLVPSLKALDSGQAKKAVQLNVDGVQNKVGAFAELPDSAKEMMLDNARTIAELRTRLPPFKAQARKISCRTLVINGQQSAVWLQRIGELVAKSVPRCEALTVAGSRHFPHMENPSEFNSNALKFISKRD